MTHLLGLNLRNHQVKLQCLEAKLRLISVTFQEAKNEKHFNRLALQTKDHSKLTAER
uniref:Uncharacterized protein n=1 Tax=Rhizophora mucronata TaxID=61149 RepID=A0A2P2KU92_RHIMU